MEPFAPQLLKAYCEANQVPYVPWNLSSQWASDYNAIVLRSAIIREIPESVRIGVVFTASMVERVVWADDETRFEFDERGIVIFRRRDNIGASILEMLLIALAPSMLISVSNGEVLAVVVFVATCVLAAMVYFVLGLEYTYDSIRAILPAWLVFRVCWKETRRISRQRGLEIVRARA